MGRGEWVDGHVRRCVDGQKGVYLLLPLVISLEEITEEVIYRISIG